MAIMSRLAARRLKPVLALALALCPLSALAIGQAAPDAPPEGPGVETAPVAQESPYTFITVDTRLKRLRTATIPAMLRGRQPIDDRFDKFFNSYFFAEMTRPKTFSEVLDKRDLLDEYFQMCARTQQAMDLLNEITSMLMYGICVGPAQAELAGGRQVEVIKYGDGFLNLANGMELEKNDITRFRRAKRDFHPAIKYNAMLIYGELNDTQKTRRRAAVPMAAVLNPLLDVAEQSGRKWPDYLRVAALVGIKRHSQLTQLSGGGKERIAGSMRKILAEPRPSSRSNDGDVWIRRLAVEVLGILQIVGAENSVTNKLSELVSKEDAGLPLRTAAASAMGKIPMEVAPDGGAKAVAMNLGNLAVALCHHELRKGETPSKKRLLAGLSAVQLALVGAPAPAEGESAQKPRGLAPVAEGEEARFVQQLHAIVGQVVTSVAANQGAAADNVRAVIKRSINQLETTVQSEKPGAGPQPPAGPNPRVAPF